MRIYVFDKLQRKVVPIEERTDVIKKTECSFQLMKDIKPYRFIADNELVTSRSRHREKIKEGNYLELGDYCPDKIKEKVEYIKEREAKEMEKSNG